MGGEKAGAQADCLALGRRRSSPVRRGGANALRPDLPGVMIDMRSILIAVALAAVPLAGPVAAQAVSPILPAGTLLAVAAEGRTPRVPAVAPIRSGVVSQGATAAAALADTAARMARVLAAVKRAGVQPRAVQAANVSLSPQYRYAAGTPPEITGYQASNSVAIRFRDIARSGAILDALVAEGANQIDGPNMSIDQ